MHYPVELAAAWLTRRCDTHKCDYKECGAGEELAVLGMTTTLGAAAGGFLWRRQGAMVGWLTGLGVGMWINYIADSGIEAANAKAPEAGEVPLLATPDLSSLARMARRFAATR